MCAEFHGTNFQSHGKMLEEDEERLGAMPPEGMKYGHFPPTGKIHHP